MSLREKDQDTVRFLKQRMDLIVMNTRRTRKVAEAIREVVSSAILFELRDPRIQNVTVLSVEIAADLRTAKVYVSVMGEATQQSLTMHGLESSRGFLQRQIADKLQLRYTPVITFVLDHGVKKSIEASRILRELQDEARTPDLDERDPVEQDQEGSILTAEPDRPPDRQDSMNSSGESSREDS